MGGREAREQKRRLLFTWHGKAEKLKPNTVLALKDVTNSSGFLMGGGGKKERTSPNKYQKRSKKDLAMET